VASQAYESPETFMPALLNGEIKVDVVLASPVLLNSLWAAGQIAPMSDFFPPSFIDAFAATPLSGANQAGALWGLPDSAGFHLLLFYNREVINLPPATIDELSELAQELGPGGLALNSYDPLWVLPWLVPPQGWLRQESGRWAVDLPAMEQALTYHQKWHQLAMTGEPAGPYSQARQRFLQGQAALLIDGEWSLSEWSDGAGPIWAVAPLPQLGQRQSGQPAAPLVLARYWAVNRATAGDQALVAAIFLEYITRPQRQLAWTSRFGLLPTRREALNDPAIVADPILRVSASQMLAGQSLPLELNPNLLFDAMRQPLRQMLDGALTPAEAAQQIQLNLAAE
jgi:maltose-binding protein MalE